jgi:high affinity Mn2+ porin
VVGVVQGVNKAGAADPSETTRANYRGDVFATLPVGSIGDARSTLAAQLRFGQGSGLALQPTYTSTPNTTVFQAATGSDQTYAVFAQAYYQLDWPLDVGRFNDLPGDRIQFNIGKLDFFAFFDQNDVAGNEAAQFLNNVFVHNPLLDSGGDIAADQYGFAPGVRLAYFHEGEGSGWGALFGVFGSGESATFEGNLDGPLVIGQFQWSPKQINGEARGNYRAYVWTNGNTTDLTGAKERHTGFGFSVDQRVGRNWNLFGRFGQRVEGDGEFNTALTLGAEHSGRPWGRANDAVGLAVGWLETSDAWKRATADRTLVGYAASGGEYNTELYYRWRVNPHLEISPDFQMIFNPGGNSDADTIYVLGVRGGVTF